MSIFTGSGVALVTPFLENGDVDFNTLEQLLDFHLENQTDAIIIVGTTGEASTMTDEEQVEVVDFTVKHINHRIPVIAGAGSNDTRHGVNLSKMCADAGIDGLLEVTPYYNKTSQLGLIKHFEAIDQNVDVPIIVYTVPGRTGMNIEPETVKILSQMDHIVGMKDATGNLGYTAKVMSLVDDSFDLYSGNDDVVVPLMSLGGKGVISVWANLYPRAVHEMCQSYFAGDVKRAAQIQLQYKEFIDALFMEASPIPIKAAMNMQGFHVGGLRLPLVEARDHTKEVLRQIMDGLQ